jgi:hypothetical protein
MVPWYATREGNEHRANLPSRAPGRKVRSPLCFSRAEPLRGRVGWPGILITGDLMAMAVGSQSVLVALRPVTKPVSLFKFQENST